jgi:hypothetical protein
MKGREREERATLAEIGREASVFREGRDRGEVGRTRACAGRFIFYLKVGTVNA